MQWSNSKATKLYSCPFHSLWLWFVAGKHQSSNKAHYILYDHIIKWLFSAVTRLNGRRISTVDLRLDGSYLKHTIWHNKTIQVTNLIVSVSCWTFNSTFLVNGYTFYVEIICVHQYIYYLGNVNECPKVNL